MAKGEFLGEFEQVVLLALVRLTPEAYGMKIRQEIEDRTGRKVSIGAVYATLDRLEQKGLVASEMTEPRAERGGRGRRLYRIELAGRQAIARSQEVIHKLLEGLKPLVEAP